VVRVGEVRKKVVPGGDCECADGSEFAFWERRGDPTKVVFFLDGGGACFDAETCAFTGLGAGGEENYDWSTYGEDPAQEDGSFDSGEPTTRSSTTASSTCLPARVTRTSAPSPASTRPSSPSSTTASSTARRRSVPHQELPRRQQVVVVGKTAG
jgi:hypothetical protein